MTSDFHIDSVKELTDAFVELPSVNGNRHFKVTYSGHTLCICLSQRFPSASPKMTTPNGLSLYNESNWSSTKLLGEEVKSCFQYLISLWGNLAPPSEFSSISKLSGSSSNPDALVNDSLSRRTVLIGHVPSAAAIANATTSALVELESTVDRVDALSGEAATLNTTIEDLRNRCRIPIGRFPRGMGSRDGVKGALLALHEEKDRSVSDMEGVAMRVAGDQHAFDTELSKLLNGYKEMHLLELQAKLVRSL